MDFCFCEKTKQVLNRPLCSSCECPAGSKSDPWLGASNVMNSPGGPKMVLPGFCIVNRRVVSGNEESPSTGSSKASYVAESFIK